jgi:hypothetical protein
MQNTTDKMKNKGVTPSFAILTSMLFLAFGVYLSMSSDQIMHKVTTTVAQHILAITV